jgi:ribokinase
MCSDTEKGWVSGLDKPAIPGSCGVAMKIIVYGSLNIDMIFPVDHIVRPGETIGSRALERGAGGKGANQAAALAKAGLRAFMAGKIGADGEFLLELLQSYGVNTGLVARYDGATGQALIQLDSAGQNAIVLFPGGNACIETGEIRRSLEGFGPGDLVLLQNEISRNGEIMEAAKRQGIPVALNPSPCDEKIANLPLELADMLFVNEIEGAALASCPGGAEGAASSGGAGGEGEDRIYREILETLAGKFPWAEIVLTAGKAGAFYGFAEKRARGEIVRLPVADTTAAGDTFTGYFIAARARGFPAEESLALACKAASLTVSRKGAMGSIPFAEEVFRESR